ncbi:MAG: hypothetical protein A2219_08160 [Elusimicrobia bacterium RIFOXYA2_FULL_50_26]|nr:MAG: hypothetical protein A2219_08160 [Elusimicrobia bacterium RIFOXYA2_FULL_50_26]OGS25130.1 MAG: hypothetical protein A2314_05940 [Elusimicrobia bacterium RIFOXYB2_FULL_50_12]
MKTLDQLIAGRRSVRNYRPQEVEKDKMTRVLEAARLAPSACNAQPWRFAAVTKPEARKKLIEEGLGGVMVPNNWAKTAPAFIVVCSDTKFITHTLAEKVQGVQYHLIDIGIACEHLVLKAAELGLGTCYIGWFNAKNVSRCLNLPGSWKPECLITLGYPAEPESPSTPRKPLDEITKFID